MSIQLNKPYKIIFHKQKRYAAHYNIPAAQALVVPLKVYGNDLSCDVRWENSNGELQHLPQILFATDNLEPLNSMKDDKLQDLFDHFYGSPEPK
jgi:hypothetical protein